MNLPVCVSAPGALVSNGLLVFPVLFSCSLLSRIAASEIHWFSSRRTITQFSTRREG